MTVYHYARAADHKESRNSKQTITSSPFSSLLCICRGTRTSHLPRLVSPRPTNLSQHIFTLGEQQGKVENFNKKKIKSTPTEQSKRSRETERGRETNKLKKTITFSAYQSIMSLVIIWTRHKLDTSYTEQIEFVSTSDWTPVWTPVRRKGNRKYLGGQSLIELIANRYCSLAISSVCSSSFLTPPLGIDCLLCGFSLTNVVFIFTFTLSTYLFTCPWTGVRTLMHACVLMSDVCIGWLVAC